MKKNSKKLIIIISIIIIILLIILAVLNNILKNKQKEEELNKTVNSYTDISDFKTIEEVATFFECKYIKMSSSNNKTDIYMILKYEPYTNEVSNESFYNRLILYCAEVLNYNSFTINDKEKNITVDVECDNSTRKINNILINGEQNYFSKRNSLLESKKIEDQKQTNFKVQSKELEEIIKNNWNSNVNLGSKDSYYNLYDIYFDEGIEVRNINNKIYNLIFTSNYKQNIVNNLKTTSTKEEIEKTLGEATYKNEQYGLLGYKGKDFYLFFNDKKEISIYKIEKEEETSNISKIVDEYIKDNDLEKLIKNLKDKYKDFDKYENDANGIILQYTLKGIKVRYKQKLDSGINFYNNYVGKIYDDKYIKDIKNEIPNNIKIVNENLVYSAEIERLTNNYLEEYEASIEYENNKDKNNSKLFYTIKEKLKNNVYDIKFLSIDKNNANSELRESANSYIWVNDYSFVYSVNLKGLYLYNVKTKKYTTLASGDEKFEIKEYKDGNLTYDNKSIKINI